MQCFLLQLCPAVVKLSDWSGCVSGTPSLSLPNTDLTTAIGYTVQTWLLDSQFVMQET